MMTKMMKMMKMTPILRRLKNDDIEAEETGGGDDNRRQTARTPWRRF
jgi:hypothetical protein